MTPAQAETSRERAKRPTLTKREIVTAAMSLIETDGIEGLTMRRLGTSLGVDAAAFYRHFPDKAALLRAIGRTALAEVELPTHGESVGWEDWVMRTRTDYRAVLLDRPYLVALLLDGHVPWYTLPALGIERQLLIEEGFAEEDHQTVFDAIDAYVVGSASIAGAVARSRQAALARTSTGSPDLRTEFRRGLRALLMGLRAELVVDTD